MNRKQRNKNRTTAKLLAWNARQRVLARHKCENCGQPGGHWIQTRGTSVQAIVDGRDDQEGFWTCGVQHRETPIRIEYLDGENFPRFVHEG